MKSRSLSIVAVLLVLTGCFRNPVTNKREGKFISEATEIDIGRQTRDQLVKEYGEMTDPVLREYVAALGKKLVDVSDRPRLNFEFTVLDADMVNAFAAPGGFIFVTRGLLQEMNSEAELAVVLGHEIGHVCAWHSINMIEKHMGATALTLLGTVATAIKAPEAMMMVVQSANLFSTMYLMGYSRENELEADRVGLRYTISAGYEPQAALRFFTRLRELEKQEGLDKWKSFFTSHPPTEDRIKLANRMLSRMNLSRRTFNVGVEPYMEMKGRLPHAAPEDLGVTKDDVYTNAKNGLSFTLPTDWKWDADRRQSLVAFRHKQGEGWGELLRRAVGPGQTVKGAAEKFIQEKHWKFIQGRDVLYPAGYGYLAQYYGPGILGGVYQYRVFFVLRGETVYILYCGSDPENFMGYSIPFEQILRSFRMD